MQSINRRLFDDFEESDDEVMVSIDEPSKSKEEYKEQDKLILNWQKNFRDNLFSNLFEIPLEQIKIPANIINELRLKRENVNEFGGPFVIENNVIVSYSGKEGKGGEIDMDINPNIKLMYHTHPIYKSRKFSPPSEIDLGTLFLNSVNSKRAIPHLVFTKEGIYVVYCHPQILNKMNHLDDLRNNLNGVVDFNLKETVQDMRILLGYTKERLGRQIEIPQKISLPEFIESMNKMGFITILHPYTDSDLIIDIPADNEILIGGGSIKYKIYY